MLHLTNEQESLQHLAMECATKLRRPLPVTNSFNERHGTNNVITADIVEFENPMELSRSQQNPHRECNLSFKFVNHAYHDHCTCQTNKSVTKIGSEEDRLKSEELRSHPERRFNDQLHDMLRQAKVEMFEDVVSWQPHGRCFKVHKPNRFVVEIMPRWFKQSKLSSFQRQLNFYGFTRLTKGPDRGGYYHELFLREHFHLCAKMAVIRVQGTGSKAMRSSLTEPDFYKMKPCKKNYTIQLKTESDSCGDWGNTRLIAKEVSTIPVAFSEIAEHQIPATLPRYKATDSILSKKGVDCPPKFPLSPNSVVDGMELKDSVESPMFPLFEPASNTSEAPMEFEGRRFHYVDPTLLRWW